MRFKNADFRSLVQALYNVQEGISRGLWPEFSLSDSKGRSHQEASVQMWVLYLSLDRGHLDISSHFHRLSGFVLPTLHTLNTSISHHFLHRLMIKLICILLFLSLAMLLKLWIGHLSHTPSPEHLTLLLLSLLDHRASFPSWECHWVKLLGILLMLDY